MIEKQDLMSEKWCWFQDDDDHFKVCDSEQEAHDNAKESIDDFCEAGDDVEYAIGRPCHPLLTISSDHEMQWIGERAFEQVEEMCAEETGAEDATIDITEEEKIELGKIVFAFLLSKSKVQWWGLSKNSVTKHKYIARSRDLPEATGGAT